MSEAADPRPFARQASHVVVHRRGSVVLINCDVAQARDVLSLLMDGKAGVATPLAASGGDLVAALTGSAAAPSLWQRMWTAWKGEGAPAAPAGPAHVATTGAPPAAYASAHLARQWMGGGSGGGALSGKPVDFMTVATDGAIPAAAWAVASPGSPPITLRRLDLPSVWLLSTALAHSVTLQQAERAVEGLHEALEALNMHVGAGAAARVPRGALHSLRSRVTSLRDAVHLFNMWGRARTALARNSGRDGALATHDGHEALAALLEDELELERRLGELTAALEHLDSSVKYVVGEQEDARMHRLEVLIVLILTLELAFTVWELGGSHAP